MSTSAGRKTKKLHKHQEYVYKAEYTAVKHALHGAGQIVRKPFGKRKKSKCANDQSTVPRTERRVGSRGHAIKGFLS